MKILLTLTLMLVSFNLFGQEYEIKGDTIYIYKSGEYEITTNFIKLTCDTIMPPSRDELIRSYIYSNTSLIALMDYYAEDCYNDSALDVSYDYYGNSVINKIEWYTLDTITDQTILVKEENIYIHNKPTFEGFINWMDNKLNTH